MAIAWGVLAVKNTIHGPKYLLWSIPVLGVPASAFAWRAYVSAIRRAQRQGNPLRLAKIRKWVALVTLAILGVLAVLAQVKTGPGPGMTPPSTTQEPVERPNS